MIEMAEKLQGVGVSMNVLSITGFYSLMLV